MPIEPAGKEPEMMNRLFFCLGVFACLGLAAGCGTGRRAVELGGSPSAEHGIGKIKTRYMELMYGREGVEQIRRIKAILDPKDILCRGNITGGSR